MDFYKNIVFRVIFKPSDTSVFNSQKYIVFGKFYSGGFINTLTFTPSQTEIFGITFGVGKNTDYERETTAQIKHGSTSQ